MRQIVEDYVLSRLYLHDCSAISVCFRKKNRFVEKLAKNRAPGPYSVAYRVQERIFAQLWNIVAESLNNRLQDERFEVAQNRNFLCAPGAHSMPRRALEDLKDLGGRSLRAKLWFIIRWFHRHLKHCPRPSSYGDKVLQSVTALQELVQNGQLPGRLEPKPSVEKI